MSEDVPEAPGGFATGSRIAGYLLEEQLGRGGMAVVFRALDERLDRRVALKILAPSLAQDEAFRQRFIRESRSAAAVDNPHIIPVFEAGEADGILYIAMRYAPGGDVRSLLAQAGPLPPGRAVEIVSQVASALDAAHGRDLVHRDVKPANMLLDAGSTPRQPDHVYLSDFGLSKASLATSGLTGTGQFLGTLDYIAPEQIAGKPLDGRVDQYGLACAAFELLAGAPPFKRDDAVAVMYAQLSETPPALTSLRPSFPPAADEVFYRALAKAPADRYATCREFCEALRGAFGIRSYTSGERAGPAAPPVTAGTGAESGGSTTEIAPTDRHDTGQGLIGELLAAQDTSELVNGPGRGRRRPRTLLLGAFAGLLVLGGGGAYVALSSKAAPRVVHGSVLGCSTATAPAKSLTVPTNFTGISAGNPFGLQLPAGGKFIFTTTPTGVRVLVRGTGTAITGHYDYPLTSIPTERPKGMALTSDGKFLLVAVGSGISVMNVAVLERGSGNAVVGRLTVPGIATYAGAVEMALSPEGHYVFLTLQYANEMAVFNLHKALSSNFSAQSYDGAVTLHLRPIGIAASPDGRWLYVTSLAVNRLAGPAQGLINVLSLSKAETSPASSLVSSADAGCGPGRVLTSADGSMVWVASRNSNAVFGFSAERLRTDPAHALISRVSVGQTPIGEILVNGGARLIVADTDINNTSATAHNLAVIDVAAALAGKPALLGYIPTGKMPREFALIPGGRYLLVADNGSAQVQWVDLSKLP